MKDYDTNDVIPVTPEHEFIEQEFENEVSLDIYSVKLLDDHIENMNRLQNNLLFSFKDFRCNVDKLLIETAGKLSKDLVSNGLLNDKVLVLQILKAIKKMDSDSKIEISVNPMNYGLVKSILPEIHNILKPNQELDIICDENLMINNFKIESDRYVIDEDLVGQIKKINNILNYTNFPEPDIPQIYSFNNDEIIIDKVKSLKYLNGFDLMNEIDPLHISKVLENEHPQTIAMILTQLDDKKSSEILNCLPEDLIAEIESRKRQIGKVSKRMMEEVEGIIYRLFNESLYDHYDMNDGVNYISDVLVNSSESDLNVLFEGVKQLNPELADKLKKIIEISE